MVEIKKLAVIRNMDEAMLRQDVSIPLYRKMGYTPVMA